MYLGTTKDTVKLFSTSSGGQFDEKLESKIPKDATLENEVIGCNVAFTSLTQGKVLRLWPLNLTNSVRTFSSYGF